MKPNMERIIHNEMIENFKEYTARRWPKASQLVTIMADDHEFEIRLIVPIMYGGWHERPRFEQVWQGIYERRMDYFENIGQYYYERRQPHLDKFTINWIMNNNHVDLNDMLYLSTWFTIGVDIDDWLIIMSDSGQTMAEFETPDELDAVESLLNYCRQYEERHKVPAREAFRILPLPIANEILEYY